jgi:SARP family transcriptional regulator, regulator of embCAB operon
VSLLSPLAESHRIVRHPVCRYLAETLQPSSATRIQLCGRIVIELRGRRLEHTLPGRQGRLLFAYLVATRPRPITRDELKDALWGHDVPAACDSVLSGVLSRLRHTLGPDTIHGRSEISFALPPDAWIDLEAAREAIHRAECAVESAAWTEAWGPARVALNVASRGFLAGEDAPWIDERRRFLREVHLRALDCIARVGLALGGMELVSAERSGRALAELAPYRESGYRLLMEVLAAEGNDADALLIYDRLCRLLREELGTVPAAATQALHKQLLQLQT